MKTVHFLSEGFVATNVRAMLFPLIVHRRKLLENGVKWKLFHEPSPDAFDCDLLIVESNVHGKRWVLETDDILKDFETYSGRVSSLAYLDSSDSTALLHPEVLPYVSWYYKGQVLKERSEYAKAHYGNRIFTDFVHETFNIEDETPSYSTAVRNIDDLNKIAVWWNSSLADWSWLGKYRLEAYARLPWDVFLAYTKTFTSPKSNRAHDVSCRMGVNYARDTVAWLRKTAHKRLSHWIATDRVSYRAYLKEMQTSKLVVSPFGWGEINYKDYETFIAGAALVKPKMDHIETWPNLYQSHVTYEPYSWNSEDLVDVIDNLLTHADKAMSIAEAGQTLYRQHISDPDAGTLFCTRVRNLVQG